MTLVRALPPQNFIFCGAHFVSTIVLGLQQKLKPLLHSSQQQMAMRSIGVARRGKGAMSPTN